MSCNHCEAVLNENGRGGNFSEELMCNKCGAVFIFANSEYMEFSSIGEMTVVLLKTIMRYKKRGWNMKCPVCNKEVQMICKEKGIIECPECHSAIKDGYVLDNGKIPVSVRRQVIINHQAHL